MSIHWWKPFNIKTQQTVVEFMMDDEKMMKSLSSGWHVDDMTCRCTSYWFCALYAYLCFHLFTCLLLKVKCDLIGPTHILDEFLLKHSYLKVFFSRGLNEWSGMLISQLIWVMYTVKQKGELVNMICHLPALCLIDSVYIIDNHMHSVFSINF